MKWFFLFEGVSFEPFSLLNFEREKTLFPNYTTGELCLTTITFTI